MRHSALDFVVSQWKTLELVVIPDLAGKTVVVIEANTGLGFEAAEHFARMGPGKLILGCRSEARGSAALEKLKQDTGYATAKLWIIDLADFASVTLFADRFEREGARLDILVENAGVSTASTKMQANGLSTPLLALRLLPVMVKTAQEHGTVPRIVAVAGEVHYWAKISEEVAERPSPLSVLGGVEYCSSPKRMSDRYFITKLFVRAFNDRLASSTPVVIDTVNLGFCHSEVLRHASGAAVVFMLTLMKLLVARKTEVGSRQLVFAVLGGEGDGRALRGEYIIDFPDTLVLESSNQTQ